MRKVLSMCVRRAEHYADKGYCAALAKNAARAKGYCAALTNKVQGVYGAEDRNVL
jgi:hypothetical protein